jgi:dephospho-CoA kinase
VKLVGLSGGIGSGKSTVGRLLTGRGAVVIDVDELSRELQQPGAPMFDAMVDRWGARVVRPDGNLVRQAVADIVFRDQGELAALHAMTNEPIEEELYARVGAHQDSEDAVVLEAALLSGAPGLYGITGLLVVDTPVETAVARLVAARGMTESDARARVANQPTRDSRLEHAGFVLDNAGSMDALERQIDRAWEWLRSQRDARLERRVSAPSAE